MNTNLLKALFILASSLLLLNSNISAAEKPEVRFAQTLNNLLDVLAQDDPSITPDQKQEMVLKVFSEGQFEFDTIIRRTLGRNWNKLNEVQQDQVKETITAILLNAYTREFQDSARPEMTFGNSKFLDPKQTKMEIPSTIEIRGKSVDLSYRLANLPTSGWQLYDILLEGVSMVSNYRKQFDEHFRTNNTAEELIEILSEKVDG